MQVLAIHSKGLKFCPHWIFYSIVKQDLCFIQCSPQDLEIGKESLGGKFSVQEQSCGAGQLWQRLLESLLTHK